MSKNYQKHSSFKLSEKNQKNLSYLIKRAIELNITLDDIVVEEVRRGRLTILNFANIYDYLLNKKLTKRVSRNPKRIEQLYDFIERFDELSPPNLSYPQIQERHNEFMSEDILIKEKKQYRRSSDPKYFIYTKWMSRPSTFRSLTFLENKYMRHAKEEDTTLEDILLRNLLSGRVVVTEFLRLVESIANYSKDYPKVRRNRVLFKKFRTYQKLDSKLLWDIHKELSKVNEERKKLHKKMLRELKKEVKDI